MAEAKKQNKLASEYEAKKRESFEVSTFYH
jgi:hypothetical protein